MIRWLAALLVSVASAFTPVRSTAQAGSASPPAEALQQAAALFAKGDWTGALSAYQNLAAAFPRHPLSRLRVGVAQMELHRLSDADASLQLAESLGAPAPQVAFRMAQLRSEQHRADEAITQLLRALNAGLFVTPGALTADAHLKPLQQHARWPSVLDAADALVRPCLHDPRFREFDFWIGDWDVTPTAAANAPANAAGGAPPARNTVTLLNNGCTIMEHWVAPGGSEGQSFNLFDRSIGQWRQTWVDNIGGQHDYRGGLVQGNMVFEGDTPAPNGQRGRIPTRLTFFHISKDSVRQFSQTSSDSGKTWTTSYDLMYVRRKPER